VRLRWCFHVAASYHLWLPDYAPLYEANVAGTRQMSGSQDAGAGGSCEHRRRAVRHPLNRKPSPVDESALATLAE
jgi:hypothetical protein